VAQVLPGLWLSVLWRWEAGRPGGAAGDYRGRPAAGPLFLAALWGYAAGYAATLLALAATGAAQPALLYLVPGVLGAALGRAWARGELQQLWQARSGAAAEDGSGMQPDQVELLAADGGAAEFNGAVEGRDGGEEPAAAEV
jgi:minor histocompatibility antigen H13